MVGVPCWKQRQARPISAARGPILHPFSVCVNVRLLNLVYLIDTWSRCLLAHLIEFFSTEGIPFEPSLLYLDVKVNSFHFFLTRFLSIVSAWIPCLLTDAYLLIFFTSEVFRVGFNGSFWPRTFLHWIGGTLATIMDARFDLIYTVILSLTILIAFYEVILASPYSPLIGYLIVHLGRDHIGA